jgi:ABC-type multidrug transport system fused ATPase/permease subunit
MRIESNNLVYNGIHKYHYVINPISTTLTGGVVFGIPGAILGLGISTIEEIGLHYGYINERYLTSSFISSITCYILYPSKITALIGVLGGLLLYTDIQKKYSNEITYSILTFGICISTRKSIIYGSIIGISLVISEQVLLGYDVIDKHYLSWSIFGGAAGNIALKHSYFSYPIGLALGLIAANYEGDINFSFKPVVISEDLYNLYSKILTNEFLIEHIQDHLGVLLNLQLIMHQLGIRLIKYEQDLMYNFEHANDRNRNPLNSLTQVTINFFLFLIPYTIMEAISSLICHFHATTLYRELDNSLRKRLFEDENALILTLSRNNSVLIDNLKYDSRIVAYEGSKLLTDAISKVIKGAYGISILLARSPDLLIFSLLFNKLCEFVSNLLSNIHKAYELEIKSFESLISSVTKHDLNNIRTITAVGGLESSHMQLNDMYNKLREYEIKGDQVLKVIEVWNHLRFFSAFIYNYYLVGYKVAQNVIPFDDRAVVHFSCVEVQGLLSWSSEKSQEMSKLYMSIRRIEYYLNATSKILDDDIKREVNFNNNSLILEEIQISLDKVELLYIERLELEMGKRYAIKAPSGIGKTSLILKVVGLKTSNVDFQGTIYYPANKSKYLLSQDDYFPLNKKLVEVIFYPKEVDESQIIQIVRPLMYAMKLTHLYLDQIEDWYNVLSGGQKKKIKVISAVVHNPDILLLDEIFNGLDDESILVIQRVIVEYLVNSLVLSVDHNADKNNRNGFYSAQITLEEGELALRDNENICINPRFFDEASIEGHCYFNETFWV